MKPGGALEALVSRTANHLSSNSVARLWKWPEPIFLQKRLIPCPSCGTQREILEGQHSGKTGFDFFGYTVGGVVVAIECKEGYTKPTLRIPGHQATALQEVARVGGVALLIWSRGHEERAFFSTQLEPARWVDGHPLERMGSGRESVLDMEHLLTSAKPSAKK